MRITRADFLKQMGLSMAGLTLGGGAAKALAENFEVRRAEAVGAGGLGPRADLVGQQVNWCNSGPGFGNRIAITFDDGPTPGITERVLEELRQRDLRATFFVIGNKVNLRPDLLQRTVAEGHEIANHTFTHPKLSSLSESRVIQELELCQEAVAKAVGEAPVWFRPPYGAFRRNQGSMAVKEGLGVMLWSVDPQDWRTPGVHSIVNTILSQTRPGSVILLHDLKQQTVDALPYVLDGLMKRNFEFINISGFLGQPYPVV
jgi:peptidoglycan-N-acetylglucosamine deacetylase